MTPERARVSLPGDVVENRVPGGTLFRRVVKRNEVRPGEEGERDDPSFGWLNVRLDGEHKVVVFDPLEAHERARLACAGVQHASLVSPDKEIAASFPQCGTRSWAEIDAHGRTTRNLVRGIESQVPRRSPGPAFWNDP